MVSRTIFKFVYSIYMVDKWKTFSYFFIISYAIVNDYRMMEHAVPRSDFVITRVAFGITPLNII